MLNKIYYIWLVIKSFILFELLKWELFSIQPWDSTEYLSAFSDMAWSFLQNFVIIFSSAVPLFAVYAIYRIIREMIK